MISFIIFHPTFEFLKDSFPVKQIDKGPPVCCQCPQSCNKSQEVAGSCGDAGLWRRPLCWKVKPPGLLAVAAGSLFRPLLSSPGLLPSPCIHLLVRVSTCSSPTRPPVHACCSVPGPPSCRAWLWAWLLVPDALGAKRPWGLRPGASLSGPSPPPQSCLSLSQVSAWSSVLPGAWENWHVPPAA